MPEIKPLVSVEICKEEARLIWHIRKVKHGEMTIFVRDGLPYRIIKIEKSVLLSEPMKKESG